MSNKNLTELGQHINTALTIKAHSVIPKKSLVKFLEIYKQAFGKELSEELALDRATELLVLYTFVYGDPCKFQEQINKNEKVIK